MNTNRFLDELIGTQYRGKDGKMHDYIELEEEDKKTHRDDEYKKIVNRLRLLFPEIPETKKADSVKLDVLPVLHSEEVAKSIEVHFNRKREEIVDCQIKTTIFILVCFATKHFRRIGCLIAQIKECFPRNIHN